MMHSAPFKKISILCTSTLNYKLQREYPITPIVDFILYNISESKQISLTNLANTSI